MLDRVRKRRIDVCGTKFPFGEDKEISRDSDNICETKCNFVI